MSYFKYYLGFIAVILSTMSIATNIAYVPKVAPGNTSVAGAGKQWPTNRFMVDSSGNCISDSLTGLMWVRNASLLGTSTWGSSSTVGTAQYKIAQMNSNVAATGYKLCGYNDWRLPNINELQSLINYAASPLNNTTPAGWLMESAGFNNVQTNGDYHYYWTSTIYSSSIFVTNTNVWYVDFQMGLTDRDLASSTYYSWPVRGGK